MNTRLLDVVLRVGPQSVHKIREGHAIADEEPANCISAVRRLPINANQCTKQHTLSTLLMMERALTQGCCCQPAQYEQD